MWIYEITECLVPSNSPFSGRYIHTQETYGKGPEYYFLNSAFCLLLEMQTYFWIKFGLSTEIGEQNLFDLKFYNFDTFSSVRMR